VISLYQLKPAFQRLLRPMVAKLAHGGVTPNQITLAALLLSVGAGLVLARYPALRPALLAIPAVMFIRMALNALDGMLARGHGMQTLAGGFLNEVCDVLSDCALYLPFVLVLPESAAWIVLFTIFAVLTEFAGVLAQSLGASRRYDGPMGKSDRAFLFSAIALLLGVGVNAGTWCTALIAAGCALALLTVFRRLKNGAIEIERTRRG
jgi:CDP-diacylglycerol---glycerol-3-phosphate 3-phosphatidyltransferase